MAVGYNRGRVTSSERGFGNDVVVSSNLPPSNTDILTILISF